MRDCPAGVSEVRETERVNEILSKKRQRGTKTEKQGKTVTKMGRKRQKRRKERQDRQK